MSTENLHRTYISLRRDELELAPEECMAVEDSPNGVKSAYSAGRKVVMVPDLTQPDDELRKMLYACVGRIDEIKIYWLTKNSSDRRKNGQRKYITGNLTKR